MPGLPGNRTVGRRRKVVWTRIKLTAVQRNSEFIAPHLYVAEVFMQKMCGTISKYTAATAVEPS